MRICVIIPTYNEAKEIGRLVKEIRQQNLDVVVIDDGSLDDTALVAEENGAVAFKNERNEGKGASLIKGFNYALKKGYDAVITMDGDGQHLPEDLLHFMRIAEHSLGGIFIGNRMHKTKNMPLVRLATNRIMSWFLSCLAKQNIPDTQCGFRLIKKEVLEKINLVSCKYETESEILIKCSRLGFKIESVPIKTVYLAEKSSINPFIDTLRFFRLIIRLWTSKH